MFVSALPDPTCNSEKSANGGNKQILLLLLLLLLIKDSIQCKKSLESMSCLVLPQHEQPYPKGLSVCWVG